MYPSPPEKKALVHLHDQARRDAQRLRREAVDDFWRGAYALWLRSLAGAQRQFQRSAAHLKARLNFCVNRSTPSTTKKV
nr:hypothetical protein [uncultured Rhodoferax sp.]